MTKWLRINSDYTLKTPWFNLRNDQIILPDQTESVYHVVEHPGFSVIVAITAENNVIMEEIYRYPIDHTILECPAGQLDDDDPEAAARRELEEETGYVADEFKHLGQYWVSPGRGNEQFNVFLARNATPDGNISREVTEQIEVVSVPLDRLYKMVFAGEIIDAKSALSILMVKHYLQSPDSGSGNV